MKKTLRSIIVVCVVFFNAGCLATKTTTSNNASQMPTTETKLAQGHGNHGNGHGGMKTPVAATTTAKLTASNVQAGTATKLVIDIKSQSGQPVDKFETFQTKLMHLIIVSDDLQTFDHIHPVYQQKGRFEVQANFPYGGKYMLFSDYKPAGQAEQVSLMPVKVSGKPAAAVQMDFTKVKAIGETKVQLITSNVKAGQMAMLAFKLQQANGQPIADLQPYLGERGHLVIVRQTDALTRADYLHAHADAQMGGASEVHFMTTFPQPGKYKLWGQFNRGGQIVTADFWVNVI
jgi:hypothetical protein